MSYDSAIWCSGVMMGLGVGLYAGIWFGVIIERCERKEDTEKKERNIQCQK
jgi:hypothetical protein